MKDCKDCKELKYLLCDYLDKTLDDKGCRKIEEHISQCGKCKEIINDMKWIVERCRHADKAQMPQDMKNELIKCINRQINKEQ